MSRELKALHKSHKDARADRNEMERRKKVVTTCSQKRSRSKVSQAMHAQQQKLLASQYRLVYEGYINVSLAPLLTPRIEQHPMYSAEGASSSTRSSYGLKATLFRLIPKSFWTTIYLSLCEQLRLKSKKEKQAAEIRRNDATISRRQRYSSNNFRELTESEFWRLWATIIFSAKTSHSNVDNLYNLTPDRIRQKLLPKSLFVHSRPSLSLNDFDGFCREISALWCQAVMSTDLFCIDESLWKFVCRINGTENNQVTRTIPRKPAGTGLLSYELCGFASLCQLPYTFGIVPITLTNQPSPAAAAFSLIDCFNSNKPTGTPTNLLCIFDSAFCAADALKGYDDRGWKYCVSLNQQYHQDISSVLLNNLSLFEFRMVVDPRPRDPIIYTAYMTQFQPSEKQKRRGTGAGTPITILNATNGYKVEHPALRVPQAPSSSSDTISSLRRLYHGIPPTIRIHSDVVRLALTPSSSQDTQPPAKRSRSCVSDSTFINTSHHASVTIRERVITREELLQMHTKDVKKLLAQLGFSTVSKLTKREAMELLWSIQDQDHMEMLASSMDAKSIKLRPGDVNSVLPMLTDYRSHFASIDKLDAFLAEADASIKHQKWNTRLLERQVMLALNNVRVVFLESWSQHNTGAHAFKQATRYLDALFDLFCNLADETEDPNKWLLDHPGEFSRPIDEGLFSSLTSGK